MNNFRHFTHLHLHSDYSLLDGAISIDSLIDFGKKNCLKSLAITDHGNIFAAVKFFERCKKEKIKPILGMEAYITNDISVRDRKNKYYHLLILVENSEGYKNLCKLIAESYTNGFYFKPRIDYQLLEKYSKGLIVTSTCIGGHIPQLLLNEKMDEACALIDQMRSLFNDRFYFEVQPGEIEEQKLVNNALFELEKKYKIPIVATADCHYVRDKDKYAHEVMLAVQTHKTMQDTDRMSFGEFRAHLRSPEEMLASFVDQEEVIWRSGEISDRCDFSFTTGKLFFPNFEIPDKNQSVNDFFTEQCNEGFEKLIKKEKIPLEKRDIYQKRLLDEIAMIIRMGFPTYFLVVSDFTKWAKNNSIPVGAGRGSVAGSLVAWALAITDIDPIKYGLLFERFLNPERISPPDIDMDFCIDGRERVIQYVKEKYGHDKVCQIVTFGTMMARGVVKDVARALGFSFEDANMITGLIPDELKISLKEALEQEEKLKKLYEENSRIKELFDIAFRLEGLVRHASKHAAGIVISPEPIIEVLPIYTFGGNKNEIVTQYAMTELESLGFLKMDFLGLQNITLIEKTIQRIKKDHGIVIDMSMVPLDDKKTLNLIARGDTTGVFQLESEGIKDVLRRLAPNNFEEVIAVNALYRPGPLGSGMVDDFIEGKWGKRKITYPFEELRTVLEETFGVIVYQEQVMRIAAIIAGYSLGEADILRKAMGKKKADVMEEQRTIFSQRAKKNGFDEKKSEELFDLVAHFAGYGFNKSHSAAYAFIAFQTAYLKANYPVEFMASIISLELSDQEKMAKYIQEAKEHGIAFLPPDALLSEGEFIPEKNAIRFGLCGIKNVGSTALASILEARKIYEKNGIISFFSLLDLRVCNKRVLEHLIYAGAFDFLEKSRESLIANLDTIINIAENQKNSAESKQIGLFDENDDGNKNHDKDSLIKWQSSSPWPTAYKIEKEREVLGLYVSQHPLDEHDDLLLRIGCNSIDNVLLFEEKKKVLIRGITKKMREIITKKGDKMAFGIIEDQHNEIEVVIFPKQYAKYQEELKKETIFVIEGIYENDNARKKIIVERIFSINLFFLSEKISSWKFICEDEEGCSRVKMILNELKNKEDLQETQKIEIVFCKKNENRRVVHTIHQKSTIRPEVIKQHFPINNRMVFINRID